jgi:hypothetical protein
MGMRGIDFINNLDSNPYLFGCENGVIDLTNGFEFRDGKPDDMVSLSCGIHYSGRLHCIFICDTNTSCGTLYVHC